MQNRDRLIREVSNLWQDLLGEDRAALEKLALLCTQEIRERIDYNGDVRILGDVCGKISFLLFQQFYKDDSEAFVDGLNEEILEILGNGGKLPTDDSFYKKILSFLQ